MAAALAESRDGNEAASTGTRGLAIYVGQRLAFGAVTLVLVSAIVFAVTTVMPSDAAQAILGQNATPESLAALRQQLNLDDPALDRFLQWLGDAVTGDFGTSLGGNVPVWSLLSDRIVNSAFLVIVAAGIAVPLGIFIGAYAALRRDRAWDNISSGVLMGLIALPEFVVGILLVVVFAINVFEWLPATSALAPGERPWEQLEATILPIVTLAIGVVPYIARIMRASTVEVLESPYVEMARLKGVPERRLLVRHAIPNALPATLQAIAITLAFLAGGVVVVEYLFNYPGVGSALRDAVLGRDVPIIQAVTVLIAAVYVIANLLADLATIFVTPTKRTTL